MVGWKKLSSGHAGKQVSAKKLPRFHSGPRMHWKAPTLLICFLVAGAGISIAHHFFYQSLEETPVPDGDYSVGALKLSRQELNTVGGTALAFLARTCLTCAASVAFAQVFWRTLRNKRVRLAVVDTLYGAPNNTAALLKGWRFFRFPLLLLIALIAWILPIASVLTPATLSISFAPAKYPRSALMHVPEAAWKSLALINTSPGLLSQDEGLLYNGPQYEVQRIAAAVASQGNIIGVIPPGPNATWELQFYGPALACGTLYDSTDIDELWGNIHAANPQLNITYISWVPAGDNWLPFSSKTQDNQTVWHWTSGATLGPMKTMNGTHPATLYVATNATSMQCRLFNVTYTVSLHFDGNDQATEWEYGTSYNPIVALHNYTYSSSPGILDSEVLQTLSWQSIMQAFGQLLTGSVYLTVPQTGNCVPQLDADSQVMSTVLLDTPELQYMKSAMSNLLAWQDSQCVLPSEGPLPPALVNAPSKLDETLLPVKVLGRQIPLVQAIPELFTNITLSMMSSPALQFNPSNPLAPPPANVTFRTYENVYSYSAARLWLIYGPAIFFTTLAVAIGLHSMIMEGVSYSDDFSTIMRATRQAELSASFRESDTGGENPLPKRLEQATVGIRKRVPASRAAKEAFEPVYEEVESEESETTADVPNLENASINNPEAR